MIFSELYSVYYTTVAKILTDVMEGDTDIKQLQKIVYENAFSESTLTILPSLQSGKWQLTDSKFNPVLKHKPSMPITLLEKRWLKAILRDKRIKLFDIDIPELRDVEPLFTEADYKLYDQYGDGDNYEDENYINNFRLVMNAVKYGKAVAVTVVNRYGEEKWIRFYPKGFEYSAKDDKIRIIADKCRYKYFNLGRIVECKYYTGFGKWTETTEEDEIRELEIDITNERNALERAMLHFAHFEKRAEKVDDIHYKLYLKYYKNDETELVIRILSFGPYLKVVAPTDFVNLIKARLINQKNCGL